MVHSEAQLLSQELLFLSFLPLSLGGTLLFVAALGLLLLPTLALGVFALGSLLAALRVLERKSIKPAPSSSLAALTRTPVALHPVHRARAAHSMRT